MDELTRLPLPRDLRGVAHEAIEDSMTGLPAAHQRMYRRYLAEEAEIGRIAGTPLPAARALERLLEWIAGGGR